MSSIELISVHVPRCVGTSLRTTLEREFGQAAVYGDYDDRPADPSSPMNLDPDGFFERMARSDHASVRGKRVIHGHFNVLKYRNIKSARRITFLRDPVERMISHYFFWKKTERHGHRLHDYFLDHNLTLDEFARLPMIRTFYTSNMFRDVDMRQFDFIGFHDRVATDYKKLCRLLDIKIALSKENRNPFDSYQIKQGEVLSNPARLSRVRDLLRDDLAFYDALRAAA